MHPITRVSLRHPRSTLTLWAVVVAAAIPGLWRLELRTDGHALVPPNSAEVQADRTIRQRFGLEDPLVVLLETAHEQGIFEPDFLRRVQSLSDRLGELPGLEPAAISSLATERRNRVFPGTLRFRPFLDPLPETPAEMDRLRADIAEARILAGTLVSLDSQATCILVGMPEYGSTPDGGASARQSLYRQVARLTAASGARPASLVGAPVAETLLGEHLIADLSRLLPAAIGIIALVLWIGCRRLSGVLLGLTEVACCLLWTFGVMGWTGVSLYLPTAVLPVLLTVIGLADEIHIFWRHQIELSRDGAPEGLLPIERTMRRMTRPVAITSLTTGLGFLSFCASPIAAVRWFGLFAALGIGFCLAFSLSAVPALLSLIPNRRLQRPGSVRQVAAQPAWRAGRWLQRHRGPVLLGLALALASATAGLGRLQVQDSWLGGFAPQSDFRQDTERFNRSFFGAHLLHAEIAFRLPRSEIPEDSFGRRGPLLSPRIVAALGELEAELAELPEVGGVLGPHAHLRAIAALWPPERSFGEDELATTGGIARLIRRFELGRGLDRRREVLDDRYERTVVTLFLEEANYRDTARLMTAVRERAAARLAEFDVRLSFAGDVAVSQTMIPAIVRTQLRSLALALIGTLGALWMLLRSLRAALSAVAPVALAVAATLGTMGWLGIPLGVATSMFCAITLGIGIDYSVHWLAAYRHAEGDRSPAPALAALAAAGPAISWDCVAIGLGFALLALSRVPPNAHLGTLVALALSISAVLTLGGLTAVLARGSRSL